MSDKSIYEVQKVIGDDALQTILDSYPGMRFYVPKKKAYFPTQEAKEAFIRNLFYDSAWDFKRIADEVGLSIDRIKQIIYK